MFCFISLDENGWGVCVAQHAKVCLQTQRDASTPFLVHTATEITDLSWFLCANMLIVSLKKQLNIRFSRIVSKDTLGSHYFQALFYSIWRNKENLCKASVRPQSGTDLASEAQIPDVESLNDLDGGKQVTWLSSTYSLTFECHFYHIFFVSRVISYIIICYIISCFLSFYFLRLWWLLYGRHVHNDGRAFWEGPHHQSIVK